MEPLGRDTARLLQLLQSFQCKNVPCDLLIRACESRPTWSSAGEIIDRLPPEAGVSEWLLDLYESNKAFFHGKKIESYEGYINYTIGIDGVACLEVTTGEQHELEVFDERDLARERIVIVLQAFPSKYAEIIGDEISERLMDVVKTSILPLLSCLTEADIEDWLLPKTPRGRESFMVSIVEFLYQVIDRLGIQSPLIPISIPRKLCNAIANQRVTNMSIVLRKVSQVIDSCNDNYALQSSFWPSGTRADQRSNALIGYLLSILLSNEGSIGKSKASTLSVAGALSDWRPLSFSKPSTMEYLVATSFCNPTQIHIIGNPSFATIDTITLDGLLLSQRKKHKEATEVLKSMIEDINSLYGPCSMQLGIVTAELANCYNIIRQEDKAESCVRKTLQGREGWSLSTRRDNIYLNLALADALIGRARYSEAVPVLESIIYDSGISATFRMMSTLRLAKSRRRMNEDTQRVFEHSNPLRAGLTLLGHIPQTLTMEYVEELACGISEVPKMQLEGSEKGRELIGAVNTMLGKGVKPSSLRDSPSWDYFSNVQQDYSRRVAKYTELANGKQEGQDEKDDDTVEMCTPISSQPPPCFPLRDDVDMSDEKGPWSERLVLSFDGKGVRALSSLLILRRIMQRIQELETNHPDEPAHSSSSYPWIGEKHDFLTGSAERGGLGEFLPCHYFDYMAGVSTGGLCGIMLGRLRMSVDDAIYRFTDYVDRIYQGHQLFPQKTNFVTPHSGYLAAQADEFFELLRSAYQMVRENEGKESSEDVRGEPFQYNGLGTRTMIISWHIGEGPERRYIWRSYETSVCDVVASQEVTIWHVARITCATPPYFNAIVLGGFPFLDGELVTSNPSHSALQEVCSQHAKAPAIFVSLGTGQVDELVSVRLETDGVLGYTSQPHRSLIERAIDTVTETKDWLDLAKRIGLDQAYRLEAGARLSEVPPYRWITAVGEGWGTFQDIEHITDTYLDRDDVKEMIDHIAKEAVRIRRARAQTERWEAFAINVEYSCVLCAGTTVEVVYGCRANLRAHLEQSHKDWKKTDHEIEGFLNAARKYRGKTSPGAG